MDKPTFVYTTYITTTPERLWQALTDPAFTGRYWGATFATDWQKGSPMTWDMLGLRFESPEQVVLESDPPRRLVHTLRCSWSEDVVAEGTSRVTWEIEQVGDSCCLTLTHDQLRDGCNPQVYGGWPMVLSGLKTWLETGEELTTPGSLMYKT